MAFLLVVVLINAKSVGPDNSRSVLKPQPHKSIRKFWPDLEALTIAYDRDAGRINTPNVR